MDNQRRLNVDDQIRAAIGSAPAADFDSWQKENADALDSMSSANVQLKPAQPPKAARRWPISFAAITTVILVAVTCWILFPRDQAFARTIKGINVAETITWVRTSYERLTSKDGKRNWLRKKDHKATYMAPGFFRYDAYDKDGNLIRTSIDDPIRKQRFTLDLRNKTYEVKDHESYESAAEIEKPAKPAVMKLAKINVGPFGWFNRALTGGGEIVGQRIVDGRKVDILRWRNLKMGIHNPKNVGDVWIDAETEEIVGTSHPGSSVFDPEKLDYRDNPPEDTFSRGTILGSITKNIVLDSEIDPAIFEFAIPEGFSKAPAQKERIAVTEKELIEWLEILAKINDDQFVDSFVIRNTKKIADASSSDNPSDLEQSRRKIWIQHERNGNSMPLWDFIEANTFVDDCMYLGKGVELGTAEKPILIYRLKLTGKYRVVFGDLRIEDVKDDEAEQMKSD